MQFHEFLARLDGVTKQSENSYMARCPAHDDTDPSLSVTLRDGKILLKDFGSGQCSVDVITAAIGLTTADLFTGEEPQTANGRWEEEVKMETRAFWTNERNAALEVAQARLHTESDHPVIQAAAAYDQITLETLVHHGCGLHHQAGQDWLCLPFRTGCQLYRRNETGKVIRQWKDDQGPSNMPTGSFFGQETVSGKSHLLIAKSPRECLLLRQALGAAYNVIGLTNGEVGKLSPGQIRLLTELIDAGVQQITTILDCDTPEAQATAKDFAQAVKEVGRDTVEVALVDISAITEGQCKDVTDFHKQTGSFKGVLDSRQLVVHPCPESQLPVEVTEAEKEMTGAQKLLHLCQRVEFFHTPKGESYATIPEGDHLMTFRVDGSNFSEWLGKEYYFRYGKPARSQALTESLETLKAEAKYSGEEREVHLRVGGYQGNIYVDLGAADWRIAEITPDGWNIRSKAPVKFRRSSSMAALTLPQPGGDINLLRQFVNYGSEADFRLMVAWLLNAYAPNIPYTVLVLQGEQGTAKSTTAEFLRMLVDNNQSLLRTVPKSEQDFMVEAHNNWVIGYDNLSGIAPWLADGMCRLSTGGGFSNRRLYTNMEESIMNAMRPQLVNGIDDMTSRGDLLDRSIVLELPYIPADERNDKLTLLKQFDRDRPFIVGALFDAISTALRRYEEVTLSKRPRMADFARWVTAAEVAFEWEEGTILQDYRANKKQAVDIELNSNPLAIAVRRLMADKKEWIGLATELLEMLEHHLPKDLYSSKALPSSQTIKSRLKRIAPQLRSVGIEWFMERKEEGSVYTIINRPGLPTPDSPPEKSSDLDSTGTNTNSHSTGAGNPGNAGSRNGKAATAEKTEWMF